MTEQEARQRLQQCLLDLLPANGSMVGNGSLLGQWTQAALAAGSESPLAAAPTLIGAPAGLLQLGQLFR